MLASVEEDRASVLDLLPHEWEVLMMIDTSRDLRGIAAALGRSEFEVAKIRSAATTCSQLHPRTSYTSKSRGLQRQPNAAIYRPTSARCPEGSALAAGARY